MENALTSLAPAQPVDHALARHVATATTALLKALHFHRFFGQPIAALSPEHNAARAEVNERTVRAYAEEAGRYAFYAGATLDHWIQRYPAAMSVECIADAMEAGWQDAAQILDIGAAS